MPLSSSRNCHNLPFRHLNKFLKSTTEEDKKLIQALTTLLGFKPDNLDVYKLAFRHKSVAKVIKEGVKDSNERLEYLGDAILDAIIAHHLFKIYPFEGEGFLTQMRSKIVSRKFLNALSVKLGMDAFVQWENRERHSSSVYGDALEALIGAIYLDKGYNTTQKFIIGRMLKIHVDIAEIEALESNYKSRLLEWCQKEKKKVEFNVIHEIEEKGRKQFVIEVKVDGKIMGEGQDFSKKKAEQLAAERACELMDIE